jgi:hypothetical protein
MQALRLLEPRDKLESQYDLHNSAVVDKEMITSDAATSSIGISQVPSDEHCSVS